MMRDLAALSDLARDHYLTQIRDRFGQPGIDTVRALHPVLKDIFEAIDYESISESLIVFKLLGEQSDPLDLASATLLESPIEIAALNTGTLTIQVLADGRLAAWKIESNPENLPQDAIIYRYTKTDGERFWINGSEAEVAWGRGYPLFGLPLFNDLQTALRRYATMVARSSECPILPEAWREPARVMWKAGPESHMRRSLYHYLRATLRDGRPDVNQESPADDRNPVDITVRWADSNRIGLIEIKWLGKSGELNPPKQTTEYTEARAKDGLRQLVDYLELTRARAPLHDRRGYLVVFDGRRAKVKAETVVCGRDDGLKYQDSEIAFDPDHLARHDMGAPVRCFCEPNWVHTAPSKGGGKSPEVA
ncbi:hypothetical protein [Kribbella sp. NBC_00359]|uniref:hypothetical protein n=1 Tax=Kribbella sp. NBC_00359 TaxID=2975966 RepID=UPI002E220FFD